MLLTHHVTVCLTMSHGYADCVTWCVKLSLIMSHNMCIHLDGHLLAGVQNKLKHNVQAQRLGQKAAEDVELEAVRRQSNYRVEVK